MSNKQDAMHLFYIYPYPQAPDYAAPTTPIQVFLLNDTLDDVVDALEVPYSSTTEVRPLLAQVAARNGMDIPSMKNVDRRPSIGMAVVAERRRIELDAYLTAEKTAELLALFEAPTEDAPGPEEDLMALLERQRLKSEAEAARLDEVFKDVLRRKFPNISTNLPPQQLPL
jgi:hypothetical protein